MTQAPGFPEILSALDGAASVLDVGCGSGRLTLEVARRGAAVTGIDVSDGALATAREHASRTGLAVRFMHADMTRPLPFADAGFAAGVSRLALMVGDGPRSRASSGGWETSTSWSTCTSRRGSRRRGHGSGGLRLARSLVLVTAVRPG